MSLALALPPADPGQAPSAAVVATLLSVRPAPRREPPFDDEIPLGLRCAATALDRPLPFPPATHRPATTALRRRYDADLADPATWARRLLIGLAESAAGKRPLQQLAGLLTPSIAQGLQADLLRAEAGGQRHWLNLATVRSARAMQPKPGIAEVSVTLAVGRRVRAAALRVERRHDQWRCTRIVLG